MKYANVNCSHIILYVNLAAKDNLIVHCFYDASEYC